MPSGIFIMTSEGLKPGVVTRGKSAYEVAVDAGFVGTPEQWLATLSVHPDDTNWVAVPAVTGFTSSMVVRRRSGLIVSRGTFNADAGGSVAAGTFLALGNVPNDFLPDVGLLMGGSYTGASSPQFQVNATSGLIQVRANGAALVYPAAANFSIAGAVWVPAT